MKALILNGSDENDITGERVREALLAELQAGGWEVEHTRLCEQKIGNCAGDFFCWVRTPGVCNIDDDNRVIAKSIVHSDLIVYLTPVTFGGYSSALKRMVDHQIQNVSPFFAQVRGETHHQKRYRKYADFLAVGWLEQPDSQAELVFHHLAGRNAINFFAKTAVSGVVLAHQTDEEIRASAHEWLKDLRNRKILAGWEAAGKESDCNPGSPNPARPAACRQSTHQKKQFQFSGRVSFRTTGRTKSPDRDHVCSYKLALARADEGPV